jgi:hypothetical protein
MMTRMAQPWERLPGESAQAFEAFAIYRDLGAERSLSKVARQLGKSGTLIDRWSARDHWVMRADSWDVESDRVHRAYLVAHRREVDKRQLRLAGAMQAKIVEALQNLDAKKLTPRDIAYWLDVTTKVQRAALGLGEKVELTGADGGPIELAGLTPEEAAGRLAEISREIRRRLEDNPLTSPLAGLDLGAPEEDDDDWGPDPEGEQESAPSGQPDEPADF